MKHLFLISLCVISLVTNAQKTDTVNIDTSRVKFIKIGNQVRNVNQRDTVAIYVFDKVDTSGVMEMLIEDNKGRITKQLGRYIFSHKIATFDAKNFFNFPSPEVIIGALDTKQRRVKPYLNGNGR